MYVMMNSSAREETGNADHPLDHSKYDLRHAVKLPIREDRNEWIATNIYLFHKQIRILYGTISDRCTPESCPRMTAGMDEYLWAQDGKSVAASAPDYIYHLLDWAQEQLDDESIFPRMEDQGFPEDFIKVCQTIARRLLRVYAHIYHEHLPDIRGEMLKEEAHMNTSFKHFIYFIQEFDLVAPSKLEPLRKFIQNLT